RAKGRGQLRHRLFGNQRFEDEIIGLLEGVADLRAATLRAAVERVEGAEDINRRVSVTDDEHRWLVGGRTCGRAQGRCGGKRGSDKRNDHPSPSRGEWRWMRRSGKRNPAGQPDGAVVLRIRPPSPIPGENGHQLVKKCLAKSCEW